MKRLCYVLVVCVMLLGTSVYAEDKSEPLWGFVDSVEFNWGYYKDAFFPGDLWQSEDCTNTVNRFSLRAETSKILPWEKWNVAFEVGYSIHKADESKTGKFGLGHDAGFREYSGNVIVTRKIYKELYLGGVAGLSYWYQRDNGMHNLGDSHCLGTWGAVAGWKHRFGISPWGFRTELRATHTSDPCNSDMGKNYLGGNLSIIYHF